MYSMKEMIEYMNEFKKGMYYVLYGSDEQNRVESDLHLSSIVSVIGYHDGFHYGKYLILTGQTMSISPDQVTATMDKCHTQALKKYRKIINES